MKAKKSIVAPDEVCEPPNQTGQFWLSNMGRSDSEATRPKEAFRIGGANSHTLDCYDENGESRWQGVEFDMGLIGLVSIRCERSPPVAVQPTLRWLDRDMLPKQWN